MIALPLALLWFGGLAAATIHGRRRFATSLALVFLAGSIVATLILGIDIARYGERVMLVGGWDVGIGIALRVDMLGIVFAVTSQLVLLCALWFEISRGVARSTFPALVLFLGLGLTGLFFTGDAFNFYVFFEISMVASYILASYGEAPRQLRAALIFIAVNILGSVLFLVGIAALYHTTGYLDMSRIATQMPLLDENPAILTATLIFVAFSTKLGLFPFHFWLPAVYTGVRPAVAAIFSGALANIGTYGLIRFGAGIFSRELEASAGVLVVLGALSVVYGGIQAVARHSPNEVLAYSAIGQVGYILIALAIGGESGYQVAIVYAVINALNKLLLFLAVSLRGWIAGAAFAIGAFSVAGVPPAAGFFAKLALFELSIDERRFWITVALLIGGALSFIYMFFLYRVRFWVDRPTGDVNTAGAVAMVAGLAIVVLAFGVYPEPLFAVSRIAAERLP